MKVQICIPSVSLSASFLQSCLEPLLERFEKESVKYRVALESGGNLAMACEKIMGCDFGQPLDSAEIPPFDRFLWIHSDIVFTWDAVARLMDANRSVISGLYLKNQAGFFATAAMGKDRSLHVDDIRGVSDPFEVQNPCGGFVLVHRSAYEAIQRPFYTCGEWQIGDQRFLCDEDVWFGHHAREFGIRSWVHPLAVVGHMKQTMWTPQTLMPATI